MASLAAVEFGYQNNESGTVKYLFVDNRRVRDRFDRITKFLGLLYLQGEVHCYRHDAGSIADASK